MYHFGEFGYVALFQGSSSVFRLHNGQECEFETEEGAGNKTVGRPPKCPQQV